MSGAGPAPGAERGAREADEPAPLGAILAGGAARRLGGDKSARPLAGRPLIAWPLAALRAVVDDVVVVAKRATPLPPLDIPALVEPDEPTHPLLGIVTALRHAAGRPVLVVAGDLPLLTPEALRPFAAARGTAVAEVEGELQPLLARYDSNALDVLSAAPPGAPLRTTVAGLAPRRLRVSAETALNVNTPADLARAERALQRRRA